MRKNIILTYEILYLNKYNFFLNSIRKKLYSYKLC